MLHKNKMRKRRTTQKSKKFTKIIQFSYIIIYKCWFFRIYKLQEKQFVLRNSLLTDLFENKHIASIHHMFVATLVNLFINVSVHDFIYSKK